MTDPTGTLLSSNGYVTREELDLIPTPLSTPTHKPISYKRVNECFDEALAFRKIGTVKEAHAVNKNGMQYFGIRELDMGFGGGRYALGYRTSNDKTIGFGMTAGCKVVVCDNLLLRGDYTPLMHKHTSKFNLEEALSVGIDNVLRYFEPMRLDIQRWQNTQLSDDEARVHLYKICFEEESLQKHLLRSAHDNYFHPKHDEFLPRNLWSLNNALTESIKALDPIQQQKAAARIGEYFQHQHL